MSFCRRHNGGGTGGVPVLFILEKMHRPSRGFWRAAGRIVIRVVGGESGRQHLLAAWRGIQKRVHMLSGKKVFRRGRLVRIVKGINDNQLHLHAGWNNILNIYTGLLPYAHPFPQLGQPSQVGREFYKNAVRLNGTDYPRDGFPGVEPGDIFFPGAKELFVREGDAAVFDGTHNPL